MQSTTAGQSLIRETTGNIRASMTYRSIVALLVLVVLVTAVPPVRSQTQVAYLGEFNEPNESLASLTTWQYITQDGRHRTITVFQYCADKCVLVPFDVENNELLSEPQAVAFFETYELRLLMPVVVMSPSEYSTDALGRGSLVCNFTAPQLGNEAKSLTVDVMFNQVFPRLLPENAGKLVDAIYAAGEKVGVVRSANVPILLLGASCVAGDFLESLAASALATCSILLQNVRKLMAYEGQYDDIMKCHSQAIERLQLAKYSPALLTQHVETQGVNLANQLSYEWSNLVCSFSRCSSSQRPQKIQSDYETVLAQLSVLQNLNRTYVGVESMAENDFSLCRSRIEFKVNEANTALQATARELSDLSSRLWGYTFLGGIYTSVLNFFYSPSYDFQSSEANQTLASSNYESAKLLNSTYRYNSAVHAANAAFAYAVEGVTAYSSEVQKARAFRFHLDIVHLSS